MKLKLIILSLLSVSLSACFSSGEEPASPAESLEPKSSNLSSGLQQISLDGAVYADYKNTLKMIGDDRVMLTVSADPAEVSALIEQLKALGMTHVAQYKHLISGVFPVAKLSQIKDISGVSWVNSNRATSYSVGFAENKGETGMYADVIKKQENLDGASISIGVLSDSYNCVGGAEEDIATGDLPSDVNVIKEYSFCAEDPRPDEGRAMMQLIHDIAPAAKLMFYTAWESPADFAQGIIGLADNGADIIVDDIGYLTMPMFQEGPIAQAVNEVTARGVTYFSAAGNSSRRSYERDSFFSEAREKAHDFGKAAGRESDLYQKIIIPKDSTISIAFQWASPYEVANSKVGASSDLDIYLYSADKNNYVASSTDSNIGHDPVEFLSYTTAESSESDTFYLHVRHMAGDQPKKLKYVLFGPGLMESERPEKLYIQESVEGFVVRHTKNDELMAEGQAVIVIKDPEDKFTIKDLANFTIEKNLEGKFFITVYEQEVPLKDIWFIPSGFSPVILASGELVLVAEDSENTNAFIADYRTESGTVFGHSNASGAISVGAMSYQQAPFFANSLLIESFSSAGGTPILYDSEGELLEKPEYHPNPAFIALDDIDTTFFPAISEELDSDGNELPNFKGTSAAAPNAAAMAALLLQKYPYLSPGKVKQAMMQGTIDLRDPANVSDNSKLDFNPCATGTVFDWGTGCGLLQADKMLAAVASLPIDVDFGDFNSSSCIDETDKARLFAAFRLNLTDSIYDLNEDGKLDESDLAVMDNLLLSNAACS